MDRRWQSVSRYVLAVSIGFIAGCSNGAPDVTSPPSGDVQPAKATTDRATPSTDAQAWADGTARDVSAVPHGAIARLGTMRFHHPEEVIAGAFSRDGTVLALGGDQGLVRLWSYPQGQLLREFPSEPQAVLDLEFSPDGRRLAISRTRSPVQIHDAGSPALLSLANPFDHDMLISFIDDGARIVVKEFYQVQIGDTRTGALISFQGNLGRNSFVSNDGKRIVERVDDWSTIKLHALGDPDIAIELEASSLAGGISPDGTALAVIGVHKGDRTLYLIDARTLKLIRKWPVQGLYTLDWTPDSKSLALAGDEQIALFDVARETPRWSLESDIQGYHQMIFSSDSATLAILGTDSVPRFIDTGRGVMTPWTESHLGPVSDMALSADGKRLLLGYGTSARIAEWNTDTRRPIRMVSASANLPQSVTMVAYSKDERHWNSGHGMFVSRWDATAGKRVPTGNCLGHASAYDRVNEHFYVFTVRGACIFEAVGGKWVGEGTVESPMPMPQDQQVTVAAVAPGGHFWVAATKSAVRVFRAGAKLAHEHKDIENATFVGISPDASLYAVGRDDGQVLIMDAHSHQVRLSEQAHRGAIRDIAFTRDGRFFATVSEDEQVRIWNVGDRLLVQSIAQPETPLSSAVFSPDGCHLYVGGQDASVVVWPTAATCAR